MMKPTKASHRIEPKIPMANPIRPKTNLIAIRATTAKIAKPIRLLNIIFLQKKMGRPLIRCDVSISFVEAK